MIYNVTMKDHKYDVVIERNSLDKIESYLDLNRKVLIITDDGIPQEYINKVLSKCNNGYVYTIRQGEQSKNFVNFENILNYLIEKKFIRTDCIVAIGGGVVGDLAGFCASVYMRGITFYNVPTTLLSQVDSSVGGKTAIDKNGIKNIIGAFYPPHKVVIDPNVLKTLDKRQLLSGLVEAIKMGATSDKELFDLIKNSKDLQKDIDEIIIKSIKVKKEVVEIDPNEKGIRKILNFGHTIGHAIESSGKFDGYLHGECVGIGMLYFSSAIVKEEILNVLNKYNLPSKVNIDKEELYNYMLLDKKRTNDYLQVICVNEIGTFEIRKEPIENIKKYL